MNPLALLALGAALTGAAVGLAPETPAPSALAADCGPLEGTIAVADDARVTADMARVSEDDARAAALGAVSGASVTDIDLDEEDGFLVYEVDLVRDQTEFDVLVDAGSGQILCTEQD